MANEPVTGSTVVCGVSPTLDANNQLVPKKLIADDSFDPPRLIVELPDRALRDLGIVTVDGAVSIVGGSGGDGAILDGVSASIKATVLDFANSNPLAVRLTDTAGDYVAAGAGTQYTEDAVAAADPIGTAVILVRKDTPAGLVSLDGDNVAQRGTNYGAAYAQIVTSAGAFVDTFGGGTQYADAAARGTATGTLMMVDDGTNIQSAKGDASGRLDTTVASGTITTVTTLTGTTTLTPGTAATNLGKAEDAGHASGDVGVMVLGVRQAADAPLSGTDLDYEPLQTDANGHLKVNVKEAIISSGTITTVSTVTNLSQQGGVAISLNTGVRDTGTQRVTIATNDVVPVTDNSGSLTVDQATATSLKAEVIGAGTAGAANAGVLTVQGIAAMTKLLVTPDSVALPANQSVNVAQIAGTNTVTGGVAGIIAVGGNVANAVAATANPVPVGGIFTTTPATLTTGQTATQQFTAAQNAKHDITTIAGTAPTTVGKLDIKGADGDVFVRQATATNLNAAVVGIGTAGTPAGNILTVQGVASMTKLLVTPDSVALPANQSVNVAQINGVTPLMGTGIMGTGSHRVTIASDNDALTVKQATAANLKVAATLDAETTKVIGTINIAAAQTVATVTTVSTLTNQSQEGGVAISLNAGAVDTGTRRIVQANGAGKTILSAGGSAAGSGNNTLVAAGTNKLKVFAFSLTTTSATAMTCIFQSGAGGTELWRCIIMAPAGANAGANLAVSPPAWLFATAAATLLNLNLSSANAVHWSVSYYDES